MTTKIPPTAPRPRPVVAIDGPAGAGKSTVTRRVAARLGYTMVDTGALYRTVAWVARERGVDWDQAAEVVEVARSLAREGALRMAQVNGVTQVLVDDRDVSMSIRTQEMGQGASLVSAIPEVREALLELQRSLGRGGGVVLEGRDIGSVVFPDAEAKFYLTASTRVRAERRRAELEERGQATTLEEVEREVEDRDRRDTERPVAPLIQAPDAVLVDSSDLTIDAVVDSIVARVREVEQELAERA